ncbi:hypothetical protein DPMN_066021 [Dreissena polymorpha]|uniref:Uncharacterized protein n=1 Tax=Dreissena polymorpha TaxID=45954 RepID=A0A9D3YT92_DREPO|nr:hypothetical protein DPMN_066021 [Dreissena polymorpha]
MLPGMGIEPGSPMREASVPTTTLAGQPPVVRKRRSWRSSQIAANVVHISRRSSYMPSNTAPGTLITSVSRCD